MNVSLRQLRVFMAVANLGSFSRAADQIGLSQSATSLSIRELEGELGLRLLDRTTRQVRLTAVGESFLVTASWLVGELDLALRDIRVIGEQRRGMVTISAAPSVVARLMPALIEACAARHPLLQIRLHDDAARDVRRKVESGEVDFGVTSGPLTSAALHVQELFQDPFHLVCRTDHPLARKRSVKWSHLAGERLVMLDNTSGSRRLIESALAQTRVEAEVGLELAQPSSVASMVKSGFGIAVMPALACPEADGSGLVVRPLSDPLICRSILLVRLADRSLSPAAEAAWGALAEMHGHAAKDPGRARPPPSSTAARSPKPPKSR